MKSNNEQSERKNENHLEIQFDKLVLASGSIPIKPGIAGSDKEGIYVISKDYHYLTNLRQAAQQAERILIVGAGYVGIELVDEFLKEGKSVTIVERMPGLLPMAMDPEFGTMIQEQLETRGCRVIVNNGVENFTGSSRLTGADLFDGQHIEADLAIVSVGFKPAIALAEKFGLAIDSTNGIVVDEYMRTSDKDIFAAGDCATTRSCYTGEYSKIMFASTAMAQGRLAGANLFQIKVVKSFTGTLGSFATKSGDVAVGISGLTEQQARAMGVQYVVGTAESVDRHPGKLPGASKVYAKLIFSRQCHTLLGAQVRGGDSVGEWINMLSVMIQKKMTDMEIDTLQIGTHPLLTSSPLAYTVINATVDAILKWYKPDAVAA